MLRITEIIEISPYYLVCSFNNGIVKKLELLPIIENHKHLNGVQNLLDETTFSHARIGEFGEIVWDGIVKTTENNIVTLWDYDISPEYAFQNSTTLKFPSVAAL